MRFQKAATDAIDQLIIASCYTYSIEYRLS